MATSRRPRRTPKTPSNHRDAQTLGAQLLKVRLSAGLSQVELAKRMRTSQSAIARLEGGSARPTFTTLERFAKATGTRLKISFEPDAG